MLWKCSSEGKKERRQLVLPHSLQRKVIQDLHEGAVGAHLGEEKVLSQLKERFYWPGCTEAVKMWCRACNICASRKMTTPARKAELPDGLPNPVRERRYYKMVAGMFWWLLIISQDGQRYTP